MNSQPSNRKNGIGNWLIGIITRHSFQPCLQKLTCQYIVRLAVLLRSDRLQLALPDALE
jgi:hypothetical protein